MHKSSKNFFIRVVIVSAWYITILFLLKQKLPTLIAISRSMLSGLRMNSRLRQKKDIYNSGVLLHLVIGHIRTFSLKVPVPRSYRRTKGVFFYQLPQPRNLWHL